MGGWLVAAWSNRTLLRVSFLCSLSFRSRTVCFAGDEGEHAVAGPPLKLPQLAQSPSLGLLAGGEAILWRLQPVLLDLSLCHGTLTSGARGRGLRGEVDCLERHMTLGEPRPRPNHKRKEKTPTRLIQRGRGFSLRLLKAQKLGQGRKL